MSKRSRRRGLRASRGPIPEALANCLRLHGFNWRPRKCRTGKLWIVYKFGVPVKTGTNRFELDTDVPVEAVLRWCEVYEKHGPSSVTVEVGHCSMTWGEPARTARTALHQHLTDMHKIFTEVPPWRPAKK